MNEWDQLSDTLTEDNFFCKNKESNESSDSDGEEENVNDAHALYQNVSTVATQPLKVEVLPVMLYLKTLPVAD